MGGDVKAGSERSLWLKDGLQSLAHGGWKLGMRVSSLSVSQAACQRMCSLLRCYQVCDCVSWSPALSRKEDLTGDMDGGVLTEYLWGCATKQVLPVVLLKGSSLRVAWTPAFSRKEGGLTGDRDDEGMLTEYLWGCTLEEVLPVILLPSSWLHVARIHSSSLQRYLQLIYPLFSKKNAYAESEWAIFVDPKAHHSSFDDD